MNAVTDEKRREVAEKLRGLSVIYDGHEFVDKDGVLEAFGLDIDWNHIARRDVLDLADLIDVPTCRYLPNEFHTWFDEDDEEHDELDVAPDDGCDCCACTRCGYEMLAGDMGWFDEEPGEHGGWRLKPHFKYCPSCGAKVVVE